MLKILIVDDDDMVRLAIEEQVRRLGHEPTALADGAAVREALINGSAFDLIILDVWMPEKDGISVLKELDPAVRPKVLVSTGGAPHLNQVETGVVAETFGADHVLYKPFEIEDLESAIKLIFP
ncbi:MAG: response regulator [Magnetovibrionaceae bacterium]